MSKIITLHRNYCRHCQKPYESYKLPLIVRVTGFCSAICLDADIKAEELDLTKEKQQ